MVREDLNLFEVWKPVPDYEGLYEVSSEGRVWSVRRQKIIATTTNKNTGYVYVTLWRNWNSKHCLLHRLVLSAFEPNENQDKQDVNHKNEVKTDNRLENLEWCDRSYNIRYGTGLKRMVEATRKTNVENGRWKEENFGLTRQEYNKKYREEHREYFRNKRKEYQNKKKSV